MNRFKSRFSEDILAMLKFRKVMGYSTTAYEKQFKTALRGSII